MNHVKRTRGGRKEADLKQMSNQRSPTSGTSRVWMQDTRRFISTMDALPDAWVWIVEAVEVRAQIFGPARMSQPQTHVG
jgi:hypothetical protein